MATPTLTLLIEKGPRKGETIECNPGGRVRIGRVIRGNTFTIKDPAISQKHLSIEHSDNGWVLSDLVTSNGTFLNEVAVDPSSPSILKDGDLIKIGEDTSILVKVQSGVAEEEGATVGVVMRSRRYPKRGVVVEKVEESIEAFKKAGGAGRRGRPRKAVTFTEPLEIENLKVEDNAHPQAAAAVDAAAATASDAFEKRREQELIVVDGVEELEKAADSPSKLAPLEDGRGGNGAGRVEEERVDMESMTLGEWFNRMEKYLPIRINDISEEIVAELREKAQRFNEYIAKGCSDDR